MNPKSLRAGISVPALSVLSPVLPQSSASADAVLPDDILPLRLKTVARLIDVSEKTVRRWIQGGLLASYKLGGARVIRKRDLRSFLDQQAGALTKEQS